MADNLLDVGPPTAKRPKLNSPLSGSDGPGERTTCFFTNVCLTATDHVQTYILVYLTSI